MLGSVKPKQENVHAPIRFPGQGIAVWSRVAAAPHLPPGQQVLFEGGDDLLRDLFSDFALL